MNHYDWLISRLDAFIRKYYLNQLLRGSLILLICTILYVLTVSVGEYFLYLPVWLRVSLVTCFLVLGAAALIGWVIIPLARMSRLGKIISHEQAARIIGSHFPEISDKLLNILQLRRESSGSVSRDLVEASIEQKAAQLSVIPISRAVDLRRNKRYLRYLIPLVAVTILILMFSPSVFIEASERLLQPTKSFEKPAPFRFIVLTDPLQAVRNTDFTLKVKVEGEALPEGMEIVNDDELLIMQQSDKQHFEYTFRNVTEPIRFRLRAAGFHSTSYEIKVASKPLLKQFQLKLDYPDYINRKDETRTSLGDLVIPAGTRISWKFTTEFADDAFMRFGAGTALKLNGSRGNFDHEARFVRDTSYSVELRNRKSGLQSKYNYQVQVIPDQYPIVQLQELRDSLTGRQILLTGTAGDDYGISRILFHYQVSGSDNKPVLSKAIPLSHKGGTVTNFQHYFDIDVLNLQQGQKLSWFVEVWDNDGVQGSKATRSDVMSFLMYTADQLDSVMNANSQQINSGLSNSSQQTKQMQQDLKEMQSKMLQSDKMDWEQQQSLMEIAQKQQQMAQNLEEIKKRFEEQMQQAKQKQFSEDLQQKQEELKSQMDRLLDEELKEQMKKLQELMAKLNKENAFQTMKQLEQQNKLFNMDLERMQELMKKLEMQMRMEDMANKMEKLAERQLDIKKETDHETKDQQSLAKEQEDLKKDLDKALQEDMKQLKELNEQSKQQQDLDKADEQAKEAGKQMQESSQELQKKQNSKASKAQDKAAQNLQQMANQMRQMAGGMSMQQIEIDIRAVRQILSNLMRLSFDQEQLMDKVSKTAPSSQAYLANQLEQNRLHRNSQMIRDSLFVLSKRLFQLAATVNKETTELEKNMQFAKESIEARNVGDAVTKQQFVMTRTNNLALMLNEMLSNLMQMQSQAMQQQGQQQGSCQNPGGQTPKPGPGDQMSDIITKQKELGNAMEQMHNAMQQRKGEGGESGESESGTEGGEYGNSEQLARMAQQQAALRKQLQELQSLLNSKGMGNAKLMKELQEQMDRTETDLVNKRLSSQLLARQKEILTRLLEAERAIREQEQDDKRSSRNPEDLARPIPPALQQHLRDRQSLMEIYRTVPAQLKPYYRSMVQQYYQRIGQGATP